MNKSAFLNEISESKIVLPNDFYNIYEEFTCYQQIAMETLRVFHRLCVKHRIHYQLAYGSLLGVIRDNGQIPWDYDVDVFVPHEEREKLVAVLKEDLDKKYYFDSYEVNPKTQSVILRVSPVGFKSYGLHVDVFFLTGLPSDSKAAAAHQKRIQEKAHDIRAKFSTAEDRKRDNRRTRLEMLVRKCVKVPFAFSNKLRMEYKELASQYPLEEAEICCTADLFARWYQFPSSIVNDTMEIHVDNDCFIIPSEFDKILKILYGDYMSLPPIENRINEVVRHYYHIKQADIR